jgi:hypothetical protein
MSVLGRGQRRRWAVDFGVLAGLAVALAAVLGIDRAISDVTPPLDLVFVLDQGRAMTRFVDSMKTNCCEKAEKLHADGVDCRFAVVPFGRGRNLIPAVPLTSDLAAFKQRLVATPDANAPPPAASSIEALESLLRMDFRPEAAVFFFLITKTECERRGELASLADPLTARGIHAIIQADIAEQETYRPFYQSGGRFFTLEGQDVTGPNEAAHDRGQADSRAASLLATLAGGTGDRSLSAAMGAKGLYSLRTDQQRNLWIRDLGGSLESEQAVSEGLAWLARHQAEDGHWSDEGRCEKESPCPAIQYGGSGAAVAETGLAVLAFQAGGHYYFNEQKYSPHVRRGLDWLVQQQKEDGCLFGPVQSWYEHGMATFALAECCAVAAAEGKARDPRYLSAAQRAAAFIERHQYARGGWQYALDSPGCGDTSVTGWQVLALKSALEADISVAPETIQRVQQFYEACGDPSTGRTGYQSRGGGTDLTTAVGLIVQEFILKQPNSPLAQKAIEYLGQRAEQGIGRSGDFYSLYNATLAMFLAGGDPWQQWNSHVRDAIVQRQEKNGCVRGSWNDRYQRTLGTAWAVLTLEVYYRYAAGHEE